MRSGKQIPVHSARNTGHIKKSRRQCQDRESTIESAVYTTVVRPGPSECMRCKRYNPWHRIHRFEFESEAVHNKNRHLQVGT